jgi:ligand-binding sensor domain-containing protein
MAFDSFHGLLQMESICRPLVSLLFLAACDGSLWIGMEGGVSHWDRQHLTNYLIRPERINSIIEDRGGRVWFVRSRGARRVEAICDARIG